MTKVGRGHEVGCVRREGGVGDDEREVLVGGGRVEVELEEARVAGVLRDREVDIWWWGERWKW